MDAKRDIREKELKICNGSRLRACKERLMEDESELMLMIAKLN